MAYPCCPIQGAPVATTPRRPCSSGSSSACSVARRLRSPAPLTPDANGAHAPSAQRPREVSGYGGSWAPSSASPLPGGRGVRLASGSGPVPGARGRPPTPSAPRPGGGCACTGARYPGVCPATQGTSRGLGHRARPPRAWPPPAAQPIVCGLEPVPRLCRGKQSHSHRAHPKHRHASPVLVPPVAPRSGWTGPYRFTPRAPFGQQAEG
jgi:hypothetical protein